MNWVIQKKKWKRCGDAIVISPVGDNSRSIAYPLCCPKGGVPDGFNRWLEKYFADYLTARIYYGDPVYIFQGYIWHDGFEEFLWNIDGGVILNNLKGAGFFNQNFNKLQERKNEHRNEC